MRVCLWSNSSMKCVLICLITVRVRYCSFTWFGSLNIVSAFSEFISTNAEIRHLPKYPGCKRLTDYTLYTQILKMELIQGSETSANYNLTQGKYPEENIQYSNHGESLK